jgi:archaemetzincin
MMKNIIISLIILLTIPSLCSDIRVGLQPYSGFEKELLDTISNSITNIYGVSVTILPQRNLPENAYVTIKTPRYRADSLLVDLMNNMPDDIDYVLGLTRSDISTTKYDKNGKIKSPETKYRDWGIFGLGYKPGPSCVVSTYRLKNVDRNLFISRLKKICIHELGHNFGLDHCETPHCVMADAVEKIQTVDSVGFELCDKCRRKIKNIFNP